MKIWEHLVVAFEWPFLGSGWEMVLVVEDEPLVRMFAVDFVEDAGFDVVEAADANQAVAILEARTDIRIVFTDIDMPGSMEGRKLARAVRDRWPPIGIIIVSRHKRPVDDDLPARPVFFPKPYDVDAVTAELDRMAALR
ncbi:response regulator [Rhizobium phaseoli]|nr:receiver domain-containing response regulator protein [Rhizobium phaseoli Ch24-10]RDJ04705.1 response regulator [Rhizobium phaseoli]RDJ06958.1 response regulator [Rhizobium phaseoli]